jgi:nucleoside-diphosphate-sugar epimerase
MGSNVIAQSAKERLRPSNSEVLRLLGDNSLIRELTGWRSSYSLEEGLKITVKWFTEPGNMDNYKPGIYNL